MLLDRKMIASISKPKLPKGLSYALKTSQLGWWL